MKQPPPNTEVDTLQCIGCTYMADISDSAPPTFNRSELIRVYDIPEEREAYVCEDCMCDEDYDGQFISLEHDALCAVDDEMDEPLMGEYEWDDEWEVDA